MHSIVLSLAWLGSIFYRGGYKPFPLWLALTLLLASTLMINRSGAIGHWRASSFDNVTLVFLAASLLSCAFSILPGISLDPALAIAALPITYWVTRHALSMGVAWDDLARPMYFSGIVVVAIALPEFLVVGQRPFATFGDANALAAFFNALFFPVYLSTLVDWQSGKSLITQKTRLLGLVVLLMAIAATTSLAGQLCFLGGLGLCTLLMGLRRGKAWGGIALVLAVFMPAYLFTNYYTEGTRDATSRIATLGTQGSFTERLDMSQSALAMYDDGPWYGIGTGMYRVLYPAYRHVSERSTTGDLAHNDYIQFLAEGGPLMLGSLLTLLGLTCWRLWGFWRRTADDPASEWGLLKTAGFAVAALCLFLHASMNFIFYVLPLSMVMGLYLARVEATVPGRLHFQMESRLSSRLGAAIPIFGIVFLAGTLGLRSLFVGLTTDACELKACESLRNEGTKPLALANLLAATQPTWMPSRDHIILRLRQQAAETTNEQVKSRLLIAALREIVRVIHDVPQVAYPYIQLAVLLEDAPSLALAVPTDLPTDAKALYRLALDRNPLDQNVRLSLAKAMERDGKNRQAFDLINQDGMRWWDTLIVTNDERVAMLRYMIPRAIGFGMCSDALGMGEALSLYVPTSPLALTALGIISTHDEVAGCGLGAQLPLY